MILGIYRPLKKEKREGEGGGIRLCTDQLRVKLPTLNHFRLRNSLSLKTPLTVNANSVAWK